MKRLLLTAVTLVLSAAPVLAQEKDLIFYGVQMEQLEYRQGDQSENLLVWDGDAFIGTDELKLRWLGEGEYDTDEKVLEKMENRLVLQTPISTFFDLKGGIRLDSPRARTAGSGSSASRGWRRNGSRSMRTCLSAKPVTSPRGSTRSTSC